MNFANFSEEGHFYRTLQKAAFLPIIDMKIYFYKVIQNKQTAAHFQSIRMSPKNLMLYIDVLSEGI